MAKSTEKTTEAKPSIHLALAAISQEINAIDKTQRNKQQEFNFRGIDDIYNALHPLFSKYGVICLPLADRIEATNFNNTKGNVVHKSVVTLGFRFVATDGSFVECKTFGEGQDHGDKATAKALSVAHKYALIQAFLIPIKDMDGDAFSPSFDAAAELRNLRIEELQTRLSELKRSFDGANATREEFDAYTKAKTAIESELYAKTTANDAPKPGTPVESSKSEPVKSEPKQAPKKPETAPEPEKPKAEPAKASKPPVKDKVAPDDEPEPENPVESQQTPASGDSEGEDWQNYRLQVIKVSRYKEKLLSELNLEDLKNIKSKWIDANQDILTSPIQKREVAMVLAALAALSK